MIAKRMPAIVTAALSLLFLALNLTQDDLESYQFPLLLAIILCLLSAMFLLSTFTSPVSSESKGGFAIDWAAVLPGLLVGIAYYLSLEWIGFYSASYLAFLIIIVLYDKSTAMSAKSILTKAVIAVLFIAALYGLFFYALHVQAPRGILF